MKLFGVVMSRTFIFLYLTGFNLVVGLSDVWVELQAPRFVVHRHDAVLRCEHSVNYDDLYKVVFFKDGHRIMQYVRERDPPFEIYNFTGAEIQLSKMSATFITLKDMDFPASGSYSCEIAMEIPLYSKSSRFHEITVIVRQRYRPKIKLKHKKLTSNDVLEATCQSAPAHPAPHLTWFINNIKVDEYLTIPNGVITHGSHRGMPLSVTNTSLQFPLTALKLVPSQTVDISCIGTIPSYANINDGYADIQNHTITVNVVKIEPTSTPAQLPVKIVATETSGGWRTRSLKNVQFIIVHVTLVFLYSLSEPHL